MFYYHHCDYYSHHRHYTQMLSLSLPLYLLSQTSANLILQFSSVAQSCPTLCDPMNHSSPGLPVQHQLPECTQTNFHWISDAIQPSHPLSSPSPSALNLSQHQSLFSESVLRIRWPNYWSFSFSTVLPVNIQDWFPLGWTGWISLQSSLILGLPLVGSESKEDSLY